MRLLQSLRCLLSGTRALPTDGGPSADRDGVGVWRLVSPIAEDTVTDALTYPLGHNARGLIFYT